MRTLILTVSAGGGHVHAASAIETYITINEPDSVIEVIDTLKYINPLIDKVVIGSYLSSLKITPAIFGKIYDHTEKDEALSNMTNIFNELMASKILPLITDFKPDIIITSHPFPTEMVSVLKAKRKISTPCICLMTDYAPHNTWIHPNINAYVVSNKDMLYDMVSRGVDQSIIHPLGIPVSPEFLTKHDRYTTLRSINLDPDKPTILVMGGSLGLGKISNVYEEIAAIKHDIQIIVISGNNKKLFRELNKLKENSNKSTVILGYTKYVNKYMQCCDLLVTKPGGLTITEALISGTPLAVFSPIPGQEEKNEDFLLRHQLAIDIGKGINCGDAIEKLITNPENLKCMRENCKSFANINCGNDIYKLIKSLIK